MEGKGQYRASLPEHPALPATQLTPTAMENLDPTQNRLTELEIKLSYTEHQLEQLDAVVVRQQQQIDVLIAELRHLREASSTDTQPGQRSLRDELPPHY